MKMIILGASAGGLDPIKVILGDLSIDLDAAVLVIRHSSRSSKSLLTPLLARHSVLPVTEVRDRMTVDPGWVYVAPAGVTVTVERDDVEQPIFVLDQSERRTGNARPSIDRAMASAALVFEDTCIGVILSGYLQDGTQGAIDVDKSDGTIIVQSPSDAEQSSMPLSVIHGDSPNFILPDVQIGRLLCDLVEDREQAYTA